MAHGQHAGDPPPLASDGDVQCEQTRESGIPNNDVGSLAVDGQMNSNLSFRASSAGQDQTEPETCNGVMTARAVLQVSEPASLQVAEPQAFHTWPLRVVV